MEDGWMDGEWMVDGWIDGWMDGGWMDGCMDGCIKLGFVKKKKNNNKKGTDFWIPQISPVHQVFKRFWA